MEVVHSAGLAKLEQRPAGARAMTASASTIARTTTAPRSSAAPLSAAARWPGKAVTACRIRGVFLGCYGQGRRVWSNSVNDPSARRGLYGHSFRSRQLRTAGPRGCSRAGCRAATDRRPVRGRRRAVAVDKAERARVSGSRRVRRRRHGYDAASPSPSSPRPTSRCRPEGCPTRSRPGRAESTPTCSFSAPPSFCAPTPTGRPTTSAFRAAAGQGEPRGRARPVARRRDPAFLHHHQVADRGTDRPRRGVAPASSSPDRACWRRRARHLSACSSPDPARAEAKRDASAGDPLSVLAEARRTAASTRRRRRLHRHHGRSQDRRPDRARDLRQRHPDRRPDRPGGPRGGAGRP